MNKSLTCLWTFALLLMSGAALAQGSGSLGVKVGGSVFGGGNLAAVGGHTKVIINHATSSIKIDVYGGGALADVGNGSNTTDSVILKAGHVLGDIYGGGLGDNDPTHFVAANVNSSVEVIINGGQVGGSVFGCNNRNGAPDSTVKVLVEGVNGSPTITGNVYGGGNLADYEAPSSDMNYPKVDVFRGAVNNVFGGGLGSSAMVTGNPQVTIGDVRSGHESYEVLVNSDVYGGGDAAQVKGLTTVLVQKCNTVINGDVYGGGNAADIVKNGETGGTTSVTVTGGTITGTGHGMVFGGGHGDKDATPDPVTANVEASTSVTISGGRINKVFGGSNSAGTINGGNEGGISVLVNNTTNTCPLHIIELYGGGNYAASQVGSIDIRCTGSGDNDRIDYVYGGANQANITGNIVLNITQGHIGNVFGGNNTSGSISGTIQVNINKNNTASCANQWYVGNVFGGGNLASYTGSPQVNILNGLVTTDVYGGGLGSSATVTGNPVVHVNGGSVGNDVFGGGSEAAVIGATHVTVTSGSVGRDVYGGGALANTGATTVDIMGGTITRDVYGGGLGDGSHAPIENGVVIVNIGAAAGATSGQYAFTEHLGSATIGGNVYGCNNSAGSPQDDVTVNIYGTAHTEGVNTISDNGYAIANVFGGGNAADYAPENGSTSTTKKATVHVYGCQNTIERTFGGGNAAATPSVVTDIQGGHINKVFGGGNGELGPDYAANVNGTVNLNIHGGTVGEFYGGSNQNGTISGQITTVVDNDGPCPDLTITEFFCGGNFVDITNDLTTTIDCSDSHITYLYGGCNQANITGNVTLNLCGGTYGYVFGGSKGRAAQAAVGEPGDPGYQPAIEAKPANITGDVTLNLYGGTIDTVFGGSNILGNILGTIFVNVLDVESTSCPLIITNIYGGSNLTNYQPTNSSLVSPVVNLVHAKYGIAGNVYGGSKGETGTTTTVKANPRVNIGYEANMTGLPATSAYNPASYSRSATIQGSVFGGGDAAKVEGNTEIYLNKRAKVIGNVYGGGNMGEVDGDTKVIINGKRQ